MKTSVIMISVMLIMTAVTAGCSRDDMALVRVRLENIPVGVSSNGNSMMNRFLAFLAPAAYAAAPSWSLPPQVVRVVISAPDLRDTVFDLPPTESVFTLEVPAGPARRITVYGIETSYGFGKEWGGHATFDLQPGDEKDAVITMLPMTRITSLSEDGPIYINWDVLQNNYNGLVAGYKIYRSQKPDSNFENVATVPDYTIWYGTDDTPFNQCTLYYFKIAVYSNSLEGEMSDPVPYTTGGICP